MDFKNWLENFKLPEDKLQVNEAEVTKFVSRMADLLRNIQSVLFALTGQAIEDTRYNGQVAKLLNISDLRLKEATGGIKPVQKSIFKFWIIGENAGKLDIYHPAIIYDDYDKILLTGVIHHELRHAQDWIRGKITQTSHDQFNEETYIENVNESRAYAQELSHLMKRIGDYRKVLQLLTQEPQKEQVPGTNKFYVKQTPFSATSTLLKYAEEFLKHFSHKNEETIPIVQDHQREDVKRAANLLSKIITKLLFRNFLKKSA